MSTRTGLCFNIQKTHYFSHTVHFGSMSIMIGLKCFVLAQSLLKSLSPKSPNNQPQKLEQAPLTFCLVRSACVTLQSLKLGHGQLKIDPSLSLSCQLSLLINLSNAKINTQFSSHFCHISSEILSQLQPRTLYFHSVIATLFVLNITNPQLIAQLLTGRDMNL